MRKPRAHVVSVWGERIGSRDSARKFFYLLDFLRIEADYDRDAWNFTPLNLTHQVLCQWNLPDAITAWERSFEKRCRESSANHLKKLQLIEKKYGMRLPSVSDRLRERFTKPLAVNRMMSHLPQVVADAKAQRAESPTFEQLRQEIDEYLVDTTGSGIELPAWMQNLDKEVSRLNLPAAASTMQDTDLNIPPRQFSRNDVEQQLSSWQHLTPRKRSAKKKPPRDEK